MIFRKKDSICVLAISIVLFVSQLIVVGSIMHTEQKAVLEKTHTFSPAYETSGVEILFGGDFVYHDITVWENIDDGWQEDYSVEIYDPGWGMIRDIVVTDIDGDDEQETIVANSGSMIHIFEHNGTDLIESHNMTHPEWSDTTQVVSLAVGDLDNDGSPILEILAGTYDNNVQSVVFKKIGDSYNPVFNITDADPRNIGGPECCVGDLDNNGDLEFIVTEEFPDVEGVSRIRLFDWQTDHWDNIRNYSFTTGDFHNMVRHVQIVDVDNDDENEVLINQDQEFVLVLEYSGGTFSKSWSCPLLSDGTRGVIAGDITNDGLIDIVVPDPVTDLIYIYETVEGSIVNTFNISLVHQLSSTYNNMDIGDIDGDSLNEWVYVYENETAFPYMWISIFDNDTVLQQESTGYLDASSVEIGNYDNDEAGTVVTTTTSPSTTSTTTSTSTTTTNTGATGPPIPLEILTLVLMVPIALIVIIILIRRQRG